MGVWQQDRSTEAQLGCAETWGWVGGCAGLGASGAHTRGARSLPGAAPQGCFSWEPG